LALDCRYPTAPTTQKKSFLAVPDTVFSDWNAACEHFQKLSIWNKVVPCDRKTQGFPMAFLSAFHGTTLSHLAPCGQ
jgi:hypothetical protein